VVELLKHDCLIMPVKTVRWIELVFGEGLSAEEASARIADEEPEESVEEATDNEGLEDSPSEAEATDNEEPEDNASESAEADSEEA
jgi:large subunit ribosomal protein L4